MKKLFSLIIVALILLTGCFSKYDISVDLTDEEVNEIKAQIELTKIEIENYEGDSIPGLEIVDLARSYEDLGKLSKAIKTYEDVLEGGHNFKAGFHNLGRLYENVGEFDLAVEQYQKIIDNFFETSYLYDITWAYIRAGNRKEAEKYFNAWQLEFRKTDKQTQDAIKQLRDLEE